LPSTQLDLLVAEPGKEPASPVALSLSLAAIDHMAALDSPKKHHPVDDCSFTPWTNPPPLYLQASLDEGGRPTSARIGSARKALYEAPKRNTIPRAVSLDKLVVRRGWQLESPKVGVLTMGSEVVVLEATTLPDGTVRKKVGRALPRTVATLGWVTSTKADLTGDLEEKLVEHGEGDADRSTARFASVSPDSMASRIAQRRLATRSASPPLSSRGKLHSPRSPSWAHLPFRPTIQDYQQVVDQMRSEAAARDSPRKAPPPPPKEGWLSAATLTARAEAHRREALAVEAQM
jgi:hypothetical protein